MAGKSPLFASSLTLDLSGLKQTYDVRPFVMQLNESDYDFLTRLWRSEGISWLIDEAELTVASNTDDIQPQKLRLIDDNNQYEALTRRAIRYHRSSATEQSDSMTSLMADRSLQPTSVLCSVGSQMYCNKLMGQAVYKVNTNIVQTMTTRA